MPKKYSQWKAMLAITKASLIATFRSPSAVAFSIGFPLIFILVFGFISGGNGFSVDVAFDKNVDTSNAIYKALNANSAFNILHQSDSESIHALQKGDLTAIINIQKKAAPDSGYLVSLKSSDAVSPSNTNIIGSVIKDIIGNMNAVAYPHAPTVATLNPVIEKIPGRKYTEIDFILPGQLGFSLLSAGVFGVAFLFFNLRQQLVLKRFFATPVRRSYMLLGEALSRVIFQMITAIIIIGIGTTAFHFTLVHGLTTFLEIMVLSFISLIVFMGCGFIVSGVAKNESTIPPFANLFTLPQFLLAGTFFPITVFPKWLQFICNLLPLTHFNNAMRSISFEGASLLDCWKEIGILLIWGVIVYAIAIKVFKWE
ncbi:MAG: ABC transporter permease [Bacteroidetes bacterium]|nr:ABC transporter permease [Bacteroidota bacterium]